MSALKESTLHNSAAALSSDNRKMSGKAAVAHQTDSEAVREFTGGAGQPIPNAPSVMKPEEVDFIGKMILDEVMELFATVRDCNYYTTHTYIYMYICICIYAYMYVSEE